MIRRRLALIALFVLLSALSSFAQFTLVTGTVTDPNGLPYAGGTIAPTLVISSSPKFTATNLPYSPPTQPVGLNASGSFVMQIADVTTLTPGGGTWSFTVACGTGCVQPAGGKGSVSFTITGITISGASQNISAQLQAAAPALSSGGGGGTFPTPATATFGGGVVTLTTTGTYASAFLPGATISVIGCSASGDNSPPTFTIASGGYPTSALTYSDASGAAATGCTVGVVTPATAQAFSAITAGTNPNALLVSGSLNPTGGGVINANQTNGLAIPANAAFVATNSGSQQIAAPCTSTRIVVGSVSNLAVCVALTGDSTISNAGVMTNVGINGTVLSSLATGPLCNTTATGVPFICAAGNFPILNQSTTGNAATATTATTAGNFSNALAGDVTGFQGATVVKGINGVNLAGLPTGALGITNTSGIPTSSPLSVGQHLTGTAAGAQGAGVTPGCIDGIALLSGGQTPTNVDWGAIIRTYFAANGSGSCVDLGDVWGLTISFITSPYGNVALGTNLPASFQGKILLPCNTIGVLSSSIITPYQGQQWQGCTGAQLNAFGFTFLLCNSAVSACPNSAANFPTGDGSPALTAVGFVPNGSAAGGQITPLTCNSSGTGTMASGSTLCPSGSRLNTSGTTLSCVTVSCAWPTGQNSALSQSVVLAAGCTGIIVKVLTATTAQLDSAWGSGGCGSDLAGATYVIYTPTIAPAIFDGALASSWYQDCVGAKFRDLKIDMNGVAGAVGYFTVNCQERVELYNVGVTHQSNAPTVANTGTKGALPFAVPVACAMYDGTLAPGTGGGTPSATIMEGFQCGIGQNGAGLANTFGIIYEGAQIASGSPKINAGPQKVFFGTIVGKGSAGVATHGLQTGICVDGVMGAMLGAGHMEWITDDGIGIGCGGNFTSDVKFLGGFMFANAVSATSGMAGVHLYPKSSGNCIDNFSNLGNTPSNVFLRDDHYGYVPPVGVGGANSLAGGGQLMTPPYCQPGTFGWGSSTYFANGPAEISAATVVLGATTTQAKAWGFTIPSGVFVTFTSISYYVATADNTADTYDLGLYLCTPVSGVNCNAGSGTGTLMAHTGTLAGTTFAPSNTTLMTQPMINAQATGLGITTLPPGSYYLALTSNTASPPLVLAGNATNLSGVNWVTATTAGNLTVPTGGTLPATATMPATAISLPNAGNNTPWIALNGAVVP